MSNQNHTYHCNQKKAFSKEFLQNQEDPAHFGFYRQVRQILRQTSAYTSADKVLIALSGGVDSSVLLHQLACFKAREGGPALIAVHVNHGVRGNAADLDMQSAEKQAQRHDIGFVSINLSLSGHLSEDAMRNERLAALSQVARKESASLIVLGQHLQDQAETFLMRVIRGADVRGLRGMQRLRDKLWFRPMLQIQKEDILREAAHRGLDFVTDKSNFDTSYTRNHMRENLIPMLQTQYNPSIIHNLASMADSFAQLDVFMEAQIADLVPKVDENQCVMPRETLLNIDKVLRGRIYQNIYQQLAGQQSALSRKHILALEHLLLQWSGPKQSQLPGGVGVVCGKDVLIFSRDT